MKESSSPAARQTVGKLLRWYRPIRRDLPWRREQNPYTIWISEIMLQQTTVAAVVPYFERFVRRFPDLESLAQAPLGEVLALWSGLGYYSRARNLHQAAKILRGSPFPRDHQSLLRLPGFGPYTARAVSSIAFSEPVGVLDGNVIRVLCRLLGETRPWWLSAVRSVLQTKSDELAGVGPSGEINQALMELGATVCTSGQPSCLVCPLKSECVAFADRSWAQIPRKRSRPPRSLWLWRPEITFHRNQICLIKNHYAPFLKQAWVYPGVAEALAKPPEQFDFRHSITCHDIFVQTLCSTQRRPPPREGEIRWIDQSKLAQISPSALLQKALAAAGSHH